MNDPGEQDAMDGQIGKHKGEFAEAPEVDGQPEDEASAGDRGRQDSRLYTKFMVFNDFVDETAKGLTDGEFQVWCVLYRFENNGRARASKKTIGLRLGKGERQVARAIAGLIRKGVLAIAERGGSNGRCNVYRLGVKTLPALPRRRKSKPKSKPKPR